MKPPLRSTTELYARYLQHPSVSIDSRKVPAGGMFFALRGERVDGNQYAASAVANGAAFAVIDDPAVVPDNPGEADRYLLVEDSQTALQQLATHHRSVFRMPVLAVTGSNGKTTTKELIAAVMGRQYRVHATPGNYNNHLGLPLTILSTPPGTEFLLLEMGANHVGEIAALCRIGRPTHGLVTNIGDAHLEGFGGRSGIIRGKGELYDYLAAHRGIAFVNGNEEHLADMAAGVDRVIHYLDSEHPAPEVPGMEIRPDAVSPNVAVSFLSAGELISVTTHLSGRHNLQNIKTAIAVGKYFKVAGRQIAAALKDYRPDNHRSQWMTHRGVRFYWDAYNANPSSVMAALESFAALTKPADSVVILGEMLELGAASEAAHRSVVLRAGQVARTVLLVGDQMRDTAREFDRPHFADSTALRDWFWAEQWEGKQVFVKGSRGNRLERLLDQDTGSSLE